MGKSTRCLYNNELKQFLHEDSKVVFGELCEKYHGEELTTTRDAWLSEIEILQEVLLPWSDSNGRIIFEYDIPRLGKRIDVVILMYGIVFLSGI